MSLLHVHHELPQKFIIICMILLMLVFWTNGFLPQFVVLSPATPTCKNNNIKSNDNLITRRIFLSFRSPLDDSKMDSCLVDESDNDRRQHLSSEEFMMSRRRTLIRSMKAATTSIMSTPSFSLLFQQQIARADDNNDETTTTTTTMQRGNGFAYRFIPPPEMEPGSKPVKTHLFEINWKSPTTPKYTFGITIDPVRINSLKEFGTPEEVAAKVVLAEVNRDGIFDVTLIKDPVAVEEDGITSYVLNYLSQGKRGDKRFVAKFCIQNQRLYALTAQVAEADYYDKEKELMKAVNSFRVLPS